MMGVTIMTFIVFSLNRYHGLAMIMVTIIIIHYGLVIISFTTMMMIAAALILQKMCHGRDCLEHHQTRGFVLQEPTSSLVTSPEHASEVNSKSHLYIFLIVTWIL